MIYPVIKAYPIGRKLCDYRILARFYNVKWTCYKRQKYEVISDKYRYKLVT